MTISLVVDSDLGDGVVVVRAGVLDLQVAEKYSGTWLLGSTVPKP